MDEDDLEFEDIYAGEEDLNTAGVLYREAEGSWSPTQDIDWEQTIDLPDAEKRSLADAATQFHYSNAVHLMLTGRLLEQAEDMETKKLALYLSFSKMRNVDAFGRYIGRVSVDTEIAPQTKEYLSRMSAEEDVVSLLLGMAVLGGTVGYGVLDHLREAGDPLFTEIADHVRQQKRDNEEILVNRLSELLDQADEERQAAIRETAAYYRERSAQIVLYHTDLLETLDLDPDEVAAHVRELTDELYGKIGIDAETLDQGPG
ncbi:MAG: hypothetical protein SVY41_02730 [Candidatus Nanohaloarchaea archaeon]|nr:hypothetical protein [Candidatus Nanohaloarchaea archaeon]